MEVREIIFKSCFGNNLSSQESGSNLANLVFFIKDNAELKAYEVSDITDSTITFVNPLNSLDIYEASYTKTFQEDLECLFKENSLQDYAGIILEHFTEYDFLSFHFQTPMPIYGIGISNINSKDLCELTMAINGDSNFEFFKDFDYPDSIFATKEKLTCVLDYDLLLIPKEAEFIGSPNIGSFQVLGRKEHNDFNKNALELSLRYENDVIYIKGLNHFVGDIISYTTITNNAKNYEDRGIFVKALQWDLPIVEFFPIVIKAYEPAIAFDLENAQIGGLETSLKTKVIINLPPLDLAQPSLDPDTQTPPQMDLKDNIAWELVLPNDVKAKIIPDKNGDINMTGEKEIEFLFNENLTIDFKQYKIGIKALDSAFKSSDLNITQAGVLLSGESNTELFVGYLEETLIIPLENGLFWSVEEEVGNFKLQLVATNEQTQLYIYMENNTFATEQISSFTLKGYKNPPTIAKPDIVASLIPLDFNQTKPSLEVVSIDFSITQDFLAPLIVDKQDIIAPATIHLQANSEWEVLSNVDFISIEPMSGNGNAIITIKTLQDTIENTLRANFFIKRVASDSFPAQGVYINVTQNGLDTQSLQLKDLIEDQVRLLTSGLECYLEPFQFDLLKKYLIKHYSIVFDPSNPEYELYGISALGFNGSIASVSDNAGSISLNNTAANEGGSDYADLSRTPYGQQAYNILKQLKNIGIVVL